MNFSRKEQGYRKPPDMNTTMNGSNDCNPVNSTTGKVALTFGFCVIFIVSMVGNSFIGIIVYRTQAMRKPINFFIVNMALFDQLYTIFGIPLTITEMYIDSWSISRDLGKSCKFFSFLQFVSAAVSIESLVLITVDRFGAVVLPLRSPLISSKLCPFFILSTWIFAMAIFSPYFIALKETEYQEQVLCELGWNYAFGELLSSSVKSYILSLFVILFYIPFFVLAVLYSIILFKLKTKTIPGEQSANTEEQRTKRNRNVLKMAIAIVLGFVLCNFPWSIMVSLTLFARDRPSCAMIRAYAASIIVVHAYCAINPCICFIFSGNYRQGLKKTLNCLGVLEG